MSNSTYARWVGGVAAVLLLASACGARPAASRTEPVTTGAGTSSESPVAPVASAAGATTTGHVASSPVGSTGPGTPSTGSAASSGPSTAASSSSALISWWPCLAGEAARLVMVGRQGDVPLGLLGDAGSRWVVFSNESDEDACSWLPFAKTLVSSGYRVALYEFTGDPRTDLTAVVDYLRGHGAGALALVGASEGAKDSIAVASELRPAPAAVVSLSAESALQNVPIAPYAARLRCPVLYVTAADDPYGATAATRGFYASTPETAKRLLVVPGQQHGTALLSDASVHAAVLSFLAIQLGAGDAH